MPDQTPHPPGRGLQAGTEHNAQKICALRFEYELLFDGDVSSSAPQMIGLINVEELASTIATSQGEDADLAPRLRVARTDLVPALQDAGNSENLGTDAVLSAADASDQKKARVRKRSANDRSRSASVSAPSSESSLLAAESVGG